MALSPGTRIGPYEVVALIGQGGMGEVYRAKDTKLGREVAIKILPDAFAHDAERLARFGREATVLASLSHANIGGIFGIEETADTKALVLELVEGPTLADRIALGAIPVDESIAIARQVGDALEAAHAAGIVHRDLKPANIKLRPDGTVKVLDFGLAKLNDPNASNAPNVLSMSPTITTPAMTQAGLILGTAAYMSPEQARGRTVDKRADIFAFGAVLFEMLTGTRAFAGDDVSDVLASVLARDPQLAAIPSTVPDPVRQVLKACLQKDPKQRVHDMADVRLAMAGAFSRADVGTPAASGPRTWQRLAVAAAVLLAAGLGAGAVWYFTPTAPRPVTRFSHSLDDKTFSRPGRHIVGVSRDGRRVAYVANTELYLRTQEDGQARPIPGTNENPSSPFFSPDGEWVGYWSPSGELKKIRVTGGTAVTLTSATNPLGVSWSDDNTIVYAQGLGQGTGIWRVSGNGGEAERIVEPGKGERFHSPQMLPGSKAVLFTTTTNESTDGWDRGDVVVHSLDTGVRKVVHKGGADPRYVPSGHVLYAAGNTIFAVPFDLNTLEVRGGTVPVIPNVRRATGANTGLAQYAVSDDGTLVYVTGGSLAEVELSMVDRSGKSRVLPGSLASLAHPRLSPDDSRIVVQRIEGDSESNIWIYEIAQAQWRQLTFDGGDRPLWAPDGRDIVYRKGTALWQIRADFSGTAQQLPGTDTQGQQGPYAWSPSGEVLLYGAVNALHAYRPTKTSDHADKVVLTTPAGSELIGRAHFSPDGRWVVYQANAGGTGHLFISPFPFGSGGHRKITNEPANNMVWGRHGREIFSIRFPDLLAIEVSTEPTLSWKNPGTVFRQAGMQPGLGSTNYDVTRDGARFLVVTEPGTDASGANTSQALQIVLNWFEELRRLAPVP